ncbi:MUT7 Exonuclease, partial [Mesembrinibis cayennensis]|nr:MUT7 Exonuclease [Mesembrinibis cayennensis]
MRLGAAQPLPGCPARGCVLQAGRRCPGSTAAISPTSPSLFFQVCNCDKYLKVSRERMRQLVEGSRQAPGDGGAGKRPSQSCDAAVPACDAAQPSCTPPRERLEGPEQPGASAALVGGTVLQVAAIPPGVLHKAELTDFYCCTRCGKVFWEGSHFGRVVSQFQDVLVATGGEQRVYELS